MRVLAGTSGFAFKEWKGPFYPEKLKDAEMLGFYSGQFPVVEINNTFYQLPKEKTCRRRRRSSTGRRRSPRASSSPSRPRSGSRTSRD
jgi:uncharacterized protein YecE (DUF72 family)